MWNRFSTLYQKRLKGWKRLGIVCIFSSVRDCRFGAFSVVLTFLTGTNGEDDDSMCSHVPCFGIAAFSHRYDKYIIIKNYLQHILRIFID